MEKRRPVHLPKEKEATAGEELQSSIISFVLIIGIYYILSGIARIITAPIRFLFTSDKEKFQAQINIAKEKVQKRNTLRKGFKLSSYNFLNQYVERFRTNTIMFTGDPENILYQNWYDSWVNGTYCDTALSYSPEVYVDDYEGNRFVNIEFLRYLKSQIALHVQKSFQRRHAFLQTIRNYYPEFTPIFSVMLDEIAEMEEKATEGQLRMELIDAITNKGIPTDVAINLINNNFTPKEIMENVRIVKICTEQGYSPAMCRFCINHGFDLKDFRTQTVNLILTQIGSEEIASAFIRGDLTTDELDTLAQEALLYDEEKRSGYIINQFVLLMKSKVMKVRG